MKQHQKTLCLLLVTMIFLEQGLCHKGSFVVAPYVHNAIDIITPLSFRVATNFKPHLP